MVNYKFSEEIKAQLLPLHESNNYRALIGLLFDFLVIFGAIMLGTYSWYLYPISVLVIGGRQKALATILHEAAHFSLAKSKKLCIFWGKYFSGYLIGQEFYNYRDSHVANHHPFLGDKEKDPDYKYHLDIGLYSVKDKKHFLFKFVLRPFLLLSLAHYAYYVFKYRMFKFKNIKQFVNMSIYWIVLLSGIIYFDLFNYFILYWIIPYFTSFMVIGWFVELAEHYPLVHENKVSLYMTRNRFSHWIEAFFLSIHAENYHLTHHLWPTIPYWNLAKAHKIMMQDKAYREANLQMGGVFLSSNQNPPFIKDLIKKDICL
ncbi:guanitoxin biosynthesis L-arginine gamma (S) hydroxylase [Aneurinibacillus thermoaerophilus]|uniref:Fatty acid desaturase family protein n=1 Tax=Aneurinibacillus thermoaerophilus TaxID=143495 RepID=A0ABX8Y6Z2_ANETH|nr:guanitoxin biosynthesis L-arginine gamma (S) hydroxylase [Aneurinibacillus thermoaerophilus]QYY41438.1 fatty acid desaturase family protein [Aneurinibacillus thermoaerophilus]